MSDISFIISSLLCVSPVQLNATVHRRSIMMFRFNRPSSASAGCSSNAFQLPSVVKASSTTARTSSFDINIVSSRNANFVSKIPCHRCMDDSCRCVYPTQGCFSGFAIRGNRQCVEGFRRARPVDEDCAGQHYLVRRDCRVCA